MYEFKGDNQHPKLYTEACWELVHVAIVSHGFTEVYPKLDQLSSSSRTALCRAFCSSPIGHKHHLLIQEWLQLTHKFYFCKNYWP